MRTLILNAGYEPVQLVSWQRAICLLLDERAELVAAYDDSVIRTINHTFPMPSVVRLKRYVRLAQRFGLIKCSRRNVLLRDRYQCQYCGVRCSATEATLDHILPVSRGGPASWENLVTSCGPCNRSKGSQTPTEAGMILLSKPRRPSWVEWLERWQFEIHDSWGPYLNWQSSRW